MGKFRQKVVEIDAVQYKPFANIPGVTEIREVEGTEKDDPIQRVVGAFVVLPTGNKLAVEPGDWIVRQPDAKTVKAVKPEAFDANFEQA